MIDRIQLFQSNNSNVSFTSYQSPLKTLFKKGRMPSVKYGLYGQKITPKNVSLEHLKPHSEGGVSALRNFALADKFENSRRSSEPLKNVCDWEMVREYLSQFNFRIKGFDGFKYQELIIKTCKSLDIPDLLPWKKELMKKK